MLTLAKTDNKTAGDKEATPNTAKADGDKPSPEKDAPKAETTPTPAPKPKENPDQPPVVDRKDTRTEEELLAILEATKEPPHRNPVTKKQKEENGINRSKRREAVRALKVLRGEAEMLEETPAEAPKPDTAPPTTTPEEAPAVTEPPKDIPEPTLHKSAADKALKDFADFAEGAAAAAHSKPNVEKVTAEVKSAEESAEVFAAQGDAAEAVTEGNEATPTMLEALNNFRKGGKDDEEVKSDAEPAQEPEQPEAPAEETAAPDTAPTDQPEVASEPVTQEKPCDTEAKATNVVPMKKPEKPANKTDDNIPDRPSAQTFYGDVWTEENSKHLNQALFWLNKAISFEAEGKEKQADMALRAALKWEAEGLDIKPLKKAA